MGAVVQELSTDQLLYAKRERARLTLVTSLKRIGMWTKAAKVADCQQRFFGYLAEKCWCAKARPVSCGERGCPHCEKRRGSKLFSIVKQLFWEMESPRFITLTMQNVQKLTPEVIDDLRAKFTRLRHLKRFKNYVKGGFYVFEITNRGKGWHPHLHVLVDGAFYPQKELSEDWLKVGGGPIVDIRKADVNGVMELCWYLVKGSQFFESPELVEALINAISGKRLAGAFGCCFNRYSQISKEEKAKKEPQCCEHGNEFEWAGKLSLRDVFLDAESREWGVWSESQLLLKMQFFDRLERSPSATIIQWPTRPVGPVSTKKSRKAALPKLWSKCKGLVCRTN